MKNKTVQPHTRRLSSVNNKVTMVSNIDEEWKIKVFRSMVYDLNNSPVFTTYSNMFPG